METLGVVADSGVGRRYMILLGRSNAREGFVRVRDARAELTISMGSEKKCLAAREQEDVRIVIMSWYKRDTLH